MLRVSYPWVVAAVKGGALLVLIAAVWIGSTMAASKLNSPATFTVTVVQSAHGSVRVTPAPSANGRYAAGTMITLSATPQPGYGIDSTWYSVPGIFGQMYHERLSNDFKITVDQDKRVGASFIASDQLSGYVLKQDIQYAQPGVKALKYDVYSPTDAHNLPLIVIIHGGGWMTNDQKVMRQLARELVRGGKFVVVSLDYRWVGTADGDSAPNHMVDLVDDIFGGLAHIQEHAAEYGADPTRIGITGDSAGGHLATIASLMTDMVGSGGFGLTPGVYQFRPSYIPSGKTAEQVRAELMSAIKASAPSYAVFRADRVTSFVSEALIGPVGSVARAAITPLDRIPQAAIRSVPQFLLRGSQDTVVHDEDVRAFFDALIKAGQTAEYTEVGGAGHAFFDWKPDDAVKATFARYGTIPAAQIREFFLTELY